MEPSTDPPARPEAAAKCGHHPDRDADAGTCGRCGTFVCAECFVDGAEPPICAPCLKRLDKGKHLNHVKVLSILMMLHGGFMAAAGVYYVLFGGVMLDELQPVAAGQADALPYLAEWVGASLAMLGIANIAPGLVQAAAGWQLLNTRHLTLGLVAIALGTLSVCGCYCFPSALVLGAYGVWVLTREDVRARFAVRVSPATKPDMRGSDE